MSTSFWEDSGRKGMVAKAVVSPDGTIIARNHHKKAPLREGDVGLEIRLDRKKAEEITPEQRMGMQSIAGAMADHLLVYVGARKEAPMWEEGNVVEVTCDGTTIRGVVQRVSQTHIRVATFSEEYHQDEEKARIVTRDFPLALSAVWQVDVPLPECDGLPGLALATFLQNVDESLLPYLFEHPHLVEYVLKHMNSQRIQPGYYVGKYLDYINADHYVDLISEAFDNRFLRLIGRATTDQLSQIALLDKTENAAVAKPRNKYRTAAVRALVQEDKSIERRPFGKPTSVAYHDVWRALTPNRKRLLLGLCTADSPALTHAIKYVFDSEVLLHLLSEDVGLVNSQAVSAVRRNLGHLISIGLSVEVFFGGEDFKREMYRIWEGLCNSSRPGFLRQITDRKLLETIIFGLDRGDGNVETVCARWMELSEDIPKPQDEGSFIYRDDKGNWHGPFLKSDDYDHLLREKKLTSLMLCVTPDGIMRIARYALEMSDADLSSWERA